MTRSFCTVIDDPAADSVLWPYGEVMARARHWCFKQICVLGRRVAEVKAEALRKFGITARQFNGIRFELDQAVKGWRGTLEFRIRGLKDSIEATSERIARLERQMDKAGTERRRASLRFRQVGKKQRLDVLRGRLAVAERELAAGRPEVCFGGRALLRDGAIDDWRCRRTSRIFLVGAKCEGAAGNQSVHWDGHALRLRMPDSLGGGYRTLTGVRFRYGQDELLRVMQRNREPATRVGLTCWAGRPPTASVVPL